MGKRATTSEPLAVPGLFAELISKELGSEKEVEDLAKDIADVQVNTHIFGANSLTVSLIDPDLSIVCTGFLSANDEGELPEVQITLDGIDYLLTDVQGTLDKSQPNLSLEFQTKGVIELRRLTGQKKAERRKALTRAEFILARTKEAKEGKGITFFAPALRKVQPLSKTTEGETLNVTGNERAEKKFGGIAAQAPHKSETHKAAKTNAGKVKAAQVAKNLTIKGAAISTAQKRVAEEIMDVASALNVGPVVTEALLFAAIGESSMGADVGPDQGHYGTFQGNGEVNWTTKSQAKKFIEGTAPFVGGGARHLVKSGQTNPIKIAEAVESGGAYPGAERNLKEARALIVARGGASSGTESTSTEHEGPFEFEIAEGEDYWSGFQKLAQEVQWLVWFENNTLYYMNAFELVKAKPLCTIDIIKSEMTTDFVINQGTGHREATKTNQINKTAVSGFTFDVNIGFGKKGARASQADMTIGGIATECTLDLICEPNFVHAGDVVVLTDPGGHAPWSTGPWDGRWVVLEATRSIFNVYTQLTLGIPGTTALPAPLDEPKAQSVKEESNRTSSSGKSGSAGGSKPTGEQAELRSKIVKVAEKAVERKSKYLYGQIRPFPSKLFTNTLIAIDCSAFAVLVYKEAGASDPTGGEGFKKGFGNTTTLQQHGFTTGDPQPGDLIFWNGPEHVAVYIGNGKCITMGHTGDPSVETVTGESKFHSSKVGYRNYLESPSSKLPTGEQLHKAGF